MADSSLPTCIAENSVFEILSQEFTAKELQQILRLLLGAEEKVGLALLNYYARTNLVPPTGTTLSRGRRKYCYSDLVLLCWLFRMKREGLPVNRFRKGLEYLRDKIPNIYSNPTDIVLLTDGNQLFLKNKKNDKGDIAEALTGNTAGQYVWVYAIGSLIEEIDKIVNEFINSENRAGKRVATKTSSVTPSEQSKVNTKAAQRVA